MDINARIEQVMKGISVSDLNKGVLATEKANKFLADLAAASPMLSDARRIVMASHTRDIDRVGYAGRILGAAIEGQVPTDTTNPVFQTNTLVAKELVAVQPITDSALEDNIEEAAFENTLIELLGDKAGYDLEELFLKGDTASADAFLKVTDGWLKKAGNQLTATDFDATKIADVLEKMLIAMPAKYLRKRDGFKFYVSIKMENNYRNYLAARNTGLGDSAISANGAVTYKGIEVVGVPNMPEGKAILVQTDNLVYGVFRDIRVENDRIAKARKTDFVLSLRADCHFENEDAAVVSVGYTG